MIQPMSRYDQGFFNLASRLAAEVAGRNYLFFVAEVDASGMDRLRARVKALGPGHVPPTYTAFVIQAAARALRLHPQLNVMIQRRPWRARIVPLERVTATVAVERVLGGVDFVFAPMLEAPEERSVEDLARALRRFAAADPEEIPECRRFLGLVRWARWLPRLTGLLFKVPGLSPALWRRFRGGSYVVTSPAKYGGCDLVLPPWPWPLTFAFGQVKERPWVAEGRLTVRRTMRLTITAERVLANGAPLARFAETVRGLLEDPGQVEESTSGGEAHPPAQQFQGVRTASGTDPL